MGVAKLVQLGKSASASLLSFPPPHSKNAAHRLFPHSMGATSHPTVAHLAIALAFPSPFSRLAAAPHQRKTNSVQPPLSRNHFGFSPCLHSRLIGKCCGMPPISIKQAMASRVPVSIPFAIESPSSNQPFPLQGPPLFGCPRPVAAPTPPPPQFESAARGLFPALWGAIFPPPHRRRFPHQKRAAKMAAPRALFF